MAARTGTSPAIAITLGILVVLTLVGFGASVISYASVQRLQNELDAANQDLETAIPPGRRGDTWEQLKRDYARGDGVVLGLNEELQALGQLITGSRRDRLSDIRAEAENVLGEDYGSLMSELRSLKDEVQTLEAARAAAAAARDAAQSDLEQAEERIAEIQNQQAQTVAALNAEIDDYKQELDRYRGNVEQGLDDFQARADDLRREAEIELAELEDQLRSAQTRIQVLENQLAQFNRDELRLTAPDEASIADGTVIEVDPNRGLAYISRGDQDKMIIGLTFEVYSPGTDIRPSEQGGAPQGKATLEVIRSEPRSAVARVIRSTRGNPVSPGDVIVNAVYDPDKTYRFVVFGAFDTNGDGIWTPREAQDIRAIINEWGGAVDDEITGETDFLVLGRKPQLPKQPKADDPPPIIQRYRDISLDRRRYDELFETAQQTSIPVLNQNRFLTLTGVYAEN